MKDSTGFLRFTPRRENFIKANRRLEAMARRVFETSTSSNGSLVPESMGLEAFFGKTDTSFRRRYPSILSLRLGSPLPDTSLSIWVLAGQSHQAAFSVTVAGLTR